MRDVGDAVRTQRSGGQPEYEPIRAACNRLAQLSTCTTDKGREGLETEILSVLRVTSLLAHRRNASGCTRDGNFVYL